MPVPSLAETWTDSNGSSPRSRSISSITRSTSADGRSILLITGTTVQPELHREIQVRDRLRFHPLRGVDHQQRALAAHQRAAHLVGEVDVPGRVDQVELVRLSVLAV
jgi:hypothetical protein